MNSGGSPVLAVVRADAGQSNAEIAAEVVISQETVQTYRTGLVFP